MKGKTILMASAAVVMAAMVAAPASAAEWWESTKISGRMYYDFTNIDHDRAGVAQSDNGTSFDIKRFYIGVDHKFNDVFSANITTDFQYSGSVGATELYIKKAYLEANISPMLDIRLGSTDMPWIPFAEGIYGYRYVENTVADRTKYGTSADWGIHFNGKFADGLLQYAVSVVNGNGYKKPGTGAATNRTDGVDVEGRLSANYKNFTLAVGGYSGQLGVAHGTPTSHTATRFNALAAYTDDKIRVGVEYFQANDWNSVMTSSHTTDKATGYSAFASYKFTPEWALFGRYDWVNPKTTSTLTPAAFTPRSVKDNYYNIGVSYTPYKMVDLALVYKHDKANDGFLSTSNGTIGGGAFVPGTPGTGAYDEVGLWGSFQW